MKKVRVPVAAIALSGVLLLGAAANTVRQITCEQRSDITVKVNGAVQTLKDKNGNAVYPITYNGTTYLPVRVLGEALGKEVGWDSATQTVSLTDPAAPSAPVPSGVIGEEAAKRAALTHAGLSADQVTFVEVKLDRDDGVTVYEVEFYSETREYDYDIDAVTGQVRNVDYEIENFSIPAQSGNYIGEARARTIAQAKAPNATLVKIELDYDDGRAVYEGKLQEGRTEYEFEIDAVTGEVVKWEMDND